MYDFRHRGMEEGVLARRRKRHIISTQHVFHSY
jgi:hypothetical protein